MEKCLEGIRRIEQEIDRVEQEIKENEQELKAPNLTSEDIVRYAIIYKSQVP